MPSPRREDGDALRCGDRSAAVTEIRAALTALGMLDHQEEDLTTGRNVALELFDAQLDQAVRAFQQHRGLLVDGIVGEATYRALKEASYRLGARTLYHQFGAPLYGTTSLHCRPGCRILVSTPGWSTVISGCRPTMR